MNGPDFQYDGLTAFAPITNLATSTKKGLMSAADKAKLDSLTVGGGGTDTSAGPTTEPMVVAGSTLALEFDSTTDPFTYTPSAPTVHDSDTSLPGWYYANTNDTTVRLALATYAKAGDFDLRGKVALGGWGNHAVGLIAVDSGNNNIAHVLLADGGDTVTKISSYQGSGFSPVTAELAVGVSEMCFRIARSGGTVTYWYSTNGAIWERLGVVASLTTAVAKVGLRFYTITASTQAFVACAWLRGS